MEGVLGLRNAPEGSRRGIKAMLNVTSSTESGKYVEHAVWSSMIVTPILEIKKKKEPTFSCYNLNCGLTLIIHSKTKRHFTYSNPLRKHNRGYWNETLGGLDMTDAKEIEYKDLTKMQKKLFEEFCARISF